MHFVTSYPRAARIANMELELHPTVKGNFSGILSRLDRRFTELEILRGFTTFQLMTILEEANHSLIIIEHDPILYEDSQEMVEYISQVMRQAAQKPQFCYTRLESIHSWKTWPKVLIGCSTLKNGKGIHRSLLPKHG